MYKSHDFSCTPVHSERTVVKVPSSNPVKSSKSSSSALLREVAFHLVKMLEIRVKLAGMTSDDLYHLYKEYDIADLISKVKVITKEVSAEKSLVARTETGFEFDVSCDLLQYLANFLALVADNPLFVKQTAEVKEVKNEVEVESELGERYWRLSPRLHGELTVDQALYKTHLCQNMNRVLGYVVDECPKGLLCMDAHCECEQVTKTFHNDTDCARIMAEFKAGESSSLGINYRVSDAHLAQLVEERKQKKASEAEKKAKGIKTARASNQDNAFKTLLCRFHHDHATGASPTPCPNQTEDFSGLDLAEIAAKKHAGEARVCLYAHGHAELRFRPEDFLNFVSDNFKREVCKNLAEKGFCAHGRKCHFAHCPDEVMFGRCAEVDVVEKVCRNQYSPESPADTSFAGEI